MGSCLYLLLATRVAEGRRVLDVMAAVSTLPSKMRAKMTPLSPALQYIFDLMRTTYYDTTGLNTSTL